MANVKFYVGDARFENSVKYTFRDDCHLDHTLHLIDRDKIIIDGSYIFFYSGGVYSCFYKNNEVLIELSVKGNKIHLDFVDGSNTFFGSHSSIICIDSESFELTYDGATGTASSSSTGESGSAQIAPALEVTYLYKFEFYDKDENKHTVDCYVGAKIVFDGTYEFKYMNYGEYMHVENSRGTSNIWVDFKNNLLGYEDACGMFFNEDGGSIVASYDDSGVFNLVFIEKQQATI